MIFIYIAICLACFFAGAAIAGFYIENKYLPSRLVLFDNYGQRMPCSIARYQIGNLYFIDAINSVNGCIEFRTQAPSREQAEKEFEKKLMNRGGYIYLKGSEK